MGSGLQNQTGHSSSRRHVFAKAEYLITLAFVHILLNAGCGPDTSGSANCNGVSFSVEPMHICLEEDVLVTWDVEPFRVPCDEVLDSPCTGDRDGKVDLSVTSTPNDLLGLPRPIRLRGFQRVTPGQPRTNFVLHATRQARGGTRLTCDVNKTVYRLAPNAFRWHTEVFDWECDDAWGLRNWEPGQIGSGSIEIRGVRNPNPFPIYVSMVRDLPNGLPQVEEARLIGSGVTTHVFDGPAHGLWGAWHYDPGSFGPDGCDERIPPGGTVTDPESGEPVVIMIRPDVLLDFNLVCTAP